MNGESDRIRLDDGETSLDDSAEDSLIFGTFLIKNQKEEIIDFNCAVSSHLCIIFRVLMYEYN